MSPIERERGQVQQMKLDPMVFSDKPASGEFQYKELSEQENPIVGEEVAAEYVGEMSSNEDFKVIKNFDFKLHRFPIPVEGIGVNSSAVFSLTSTLSNRSLEIFASGWFVGKNLVDSYQLFGGATLVVNGINLGRQTFVIPAYDYISKGYPYQTIGEASFFHLFTKKDKVHLVLDLWIRTEVDMKSNDGLWKYPEKKVVIQ